MSFQLSPDREYYWDGSRWVRAVSPDGHWRWDGTAWRPAQKQPRSNRGVVVVIGVVALVVLVVAGIGAFVVARVLPLEQPGFAGVGLVCKGSADSAGSPVASGDTVCGYRLGTAQLTASCDGAQIPDGTRARHRTSSDASSSDFDMPVDADGCDLSARPGTIVWLETLNDTPPDVIVVADFIPRTDWGLIGIQIGCGGATCVDFFIDPAGVYRLEEESAGNWKTIARGALPLFTISHLDQLNRMVVGYRDRSVQAFLNGYAVVRATTTVDHVPGYAAIYSDDRIGTQAAFVHARTLDVFSAT